MAAPQNYVSVSRRPLDVEDYIDMLRRHRSWIIGPMFAGLVVAVVVAFLWPDTYESTAILRITPQLIPEQFVPSAMSMRMAQRLESLRTEILSRTSLGAIILNDKFKLYPKLREKLTNEDAIAQMQKDVKVVPIAEESSSDQRRVATAFMIRFSYPDKYKAQSVVSELVSRFVSQNTTVQRNSADQTKGFLGEELKAAKEKLDGLTASIAEFRAANQGKLPEEMNYNMNQVTNLWMQFSQANERLSRTQQNKAMYETNLSNRMALKNTLSTLTEDVAAPAQQIRNQKLINLDSQIMQTEMALAAAKELYTDDWPQVKELKMSLDVLKKNKAAEQAKFDEELAAARPADQPKRGMTPQQSQNVTMVEGEINSLKTSIANSEQEIKAIIAEKSSIERKIAEMQARIDAEPMVDQKWQELTRDLATTKAQYEDLLRREASAETAKNLEDRGAGEQLEVLDPASLPATPSEPNRWMIAGVGTGIGLLMGLVLAGAKEAKDTSLKNLKDVRAYTSLPVLSSIPLLENALLIRRKRRLFWLGWSTAVIIGAAAMSASMWYYYTPKGQ